MSDESAAPAVVVDVSPPAAASPSAQSPSATPSVHFSEIVTTNGGADDDVASSSSRRSGKMSATSQAIVDSSRLLLNEKSSAAPTLHEGVIELLNNRAKTPETTLYSGLGTRFSAMTAPRFKRIDFDDRFEEQTATRREPWKQWQENIKDSYYKAKKTIERNKEAADFLDQQLNRTKPKTSRPDSPFHYLDGESLLPRKSSWIENGAMEPRGLHSSLPTSYSTSNIFADSGPYAAPAVSTSQGIEGSSYVSRYEKRANDVESRLLRTAALPDRMKTLTTRDFRNGPSPSPGSLTEQYLDDADSSVYMPRPYYSRPRRDDPDYFDFDLNHSVDMYRRPEGKYTPRGPQDWENKLLGEARTKGHAPLSGYLFTKGDNDWRSNGTSFLSAALRTPKFWEQRFESIGRQVRESNPVSLDSINRFGIRFLSRKWLPTIYWYLARNKPVPNRFTEYRDPDFEDYEDPRDDD